MPNAPFSNPFRPGAGHRPPYLAGRIHEINEFKRLLRQTVITDNLVLTGLRGVGKTVLLEALKPIAVNEKWLWVGTDLSESASISEENLANRILTDLSIVTGAIKVGIEIKSRIGFSSEAEKRDITLGYDTLLQIYQKAHGLVVDKLKAVFSTVAPIVADANRKGIIFAYDEAQNLSDHAQKDQYPLSMLLDLFQSLQRQNISFMLVLAGLPTLFPKLVESRTYAERMFRVLFLSQLSEKESKEAIKKPIEASGCPVQFYPAAVMQIYKFSGGYPYFIQFICREAYDSYLQKITDGKPPTVPITEIIRKLDTDFFAGRWARVTDRQQELLYVIANLENETDEFTVMEIMSASKRFLEKPFGRSHINQMLSTLITTGLVYRDRHGKYLFAVPLMADFIKRTVGTTREENPNV